VRATSEEILGCLTGMHDAWSCRVYNLKRSYKYGVHSLEHLTNCTPTLLPHVSTVASLRGVSLSLSVRLVEAMPAKMQAQGQAEFARWLAEQAPGTLRTAHMTPHVLHSHRRPRTQPLTCSTCCR
jgi:hypothetical protein